jgi:hypothetical protein
VIVGIAIYEGVVAATTDSSDEYGPHPIEF